MLKKDFDNNSLGYLFRKQKTNFFYTIVLRKFKNSCLEIILFNAMTDRQTEGGVFSISQDCILDVSSRGKH